MVLQFKNFYLISNPILKIYMLHTIKTLFYYSKLMHTIIKS